MNIPHRTILFNNKDPQCFNKRMMSLMQKCTLLLKMPRKNNVKVIACFNNINDRLALLISIAKKIILLEWLKS